MLSSISLKRKVTNTGCRTKTRKRSHSATIASSSNAKNVNIPSIAGIPPNVVPILLHAIKSQKKFITLMMNVDVQKPSEVANQQKGSAKTSIMVRIELSQTSDKRSKLQNSRTLADEAIVQLIKILQKEKHQTNSSIINASFDFVYKMALDVKKCKILLRRCGIRIMSFLLHSIAGCRSWLYEEESKLKDFCSALANHDHQSTSGNSSNFKAMQQEGLGILHSLADKYGSFQPKWIVATRYMEDQKGILLSSPYNSSPSGSCRNVSNNVMQLRKVRDYAFEHAKRECKRVNKILHRAELCFQVLVPRIGVDDDTPKPHILQEGIDFDEDDIEWEDGDGNEEATEEDHKTSVERTLTIMAHTGALSNGALCVHIDMDERSHKAYLGIDKNREDLENGQDLLTARTHLCKCVELLSKHEPRLSRWIDALATADNLTDKQQSCSSQTPSSLTLLPEAIRKQKVPIMRLLIDLKQEVVQTLASASRLGILGEVSLEREAAVDRVKESPVSFKPPIKQDSLNKNYETEVPFQSWQDVFGIKSNCNRNTKDKISYNHQKGRKQAKRKVQIKLRKS